jgi:hypothetical protein
MHFQLLKLVIWPRKTELGYQEVVFQPGKLNVITGSSRTGKSAIIPIIDYCLASSDCLIPIDTIRDHTSWYGVLFETLDEQILIARGVPDSSKVSNDFYVARGKSLTVPVIIEKPTENLDDVKALLNTIGYLPFFELSQNDAKSGYQARLSFRDLTPFMFQSQDIVANQNILFYKTHKHEHRERLRNWFPYILGAENIEVLKAKAQLAEVDKQLSRLKREYDKAKSVSSRWVGNILGQLQVAKQYGLTEEALNASLSPEELVEIANDIIENIPDFSKTTVSDIDQNGSQLMELQQQEERLSFQIGGLNKRLNDIKQLRSGLTEYSGSIQKRVQRLHISEWLNDVATRESNCPACGSNEHPQANNELQKIASAFHRYETDLKKVTEIPTSFSREEERIKSDLTGLIDRKNLVQTQQRTILDASQKSQEEFQQRKNMFLFLGHLRASMDTFRELADDGNLAQEIDRLEAEYSRLLKLTDSRLVRERVDAATTRISQGIFEYLKTLDVEEKYKEVAPRFEIDDLTISVLSSDSHWHVLSEVGSASNWVSFHIALMCSLQDYFLKQAYSSVPSFVIFDQPSQVYFPKLQPKTNVDGLDQNKYTNEDADAVKAIFITIASSILKSNGSWQAIILDHADDDIYGGIEGVHEVVIWRNGNKLIPETWYS